MSCSGRAITGHPSLHGSGSFFNAASIERAFKNIHELHPGFTGVFAAEAPIQVLANIATALHIANGSLATLHSLTWKSKVDVDGIVLQFRAASDGDTVDVPEPHAVNIAICSDLNLDGTLDKLADGRYLLPLLLKTVERKRRIKVGKSLVSFMELKAVSTRNKPRRSPKRSPQISKRYPQNSADHHMAPLDHRKFIKDLRSSSQITTGSPQIAGLRIRIGNVLRHHLAAFVGRRRPQLENARVVDETLRRGAGITAALKFGRSVCTTSLNSEILL